MKTLTCAQLGGMCDTKLSAPSKEEMLAKGMEHLKVAHPEMYQTVTTMAKDNPMMVEWQKTFDTTWDTAPVE